jgi:hypothetical protein
VNKTAPTKKGKGKRTRDDDIPPQPSPEAQSVYKCLLELREHLHCQGHSRGRAVMYCWVRPATDKLAGEHVDMDNDMMSLWAKHMVSESI